MNRIIAFVFLALAFSVSVIAQEAKPEPSVLITNAKIFDGRALGPAHHPWYSCLYNKVCCFGDLYLQ